MSVADRIRVGVAAAVAGIIVVGVLVAAYLGHWWLREDSRDRSAEIRRHGYEVQRTVRSELTDKATELATLDAQLVTADLTAEQRQAVRAQRQALASQFCDLADQAVGDLELRIEQAIAAECGSR